MGRTRAARCVERHRRRSLLVPAPLPSKKISRSPEPRNHIARLAVRVENVMQAVARDRAVQDAAVAEVDRDLRGGADGFPVQDPVPAELVRDRRVRVERSAEEPAVRAAELLVEPPEEAEGKDGLSFALARPRALPAGSCTSRGRTTRRRAGARPRRSGLAAGSTRAGTRLRRGRLSSGRFRRRSRRGARPGGSGRRRGRPQEEDFLRR